MSNILITGGAGFLGTALCNKLAEQGHQVVSFDNYSRKSHINIGLDKRVKIFDGDITCNEDIDTSNSWSIYKNKDINDQGNIIYGSYEFDTIYHLAFINGTKSFYEVPHKVLEVGVKGIVNILQFATMSAGKSPKFILASSSEVYGQPTHIPTTEKERLIISDPHNSRYSYAGGKIISELMTINYSKMHKFDAAIFRPHNIYGANMGFEHIIPEIIKKIIEPKNPQYQDGKLLIHIQGTGKESRSFCYIDDAVDGIILTASSANQSTPIFNVGTGDEIKISDLVYMIADILKTRIKIIPGKLTKGSTSRRCPDISKLKALGYEPKISLREGLEKTIKWYKEYLEKENNDNTNS